MKRKIYYSIEVECKDEDLINFIELKRPAGFIYEYMEEIKPQQDDFFLLLGKIFKPEKI